MLLGRRWLSEQVGLVLDLGLGCAEFEADGKKFRGELQPVACAVEAEMSEGVNAIIEDAEVDAEICSMNLSSFSEDPQLQNELRNVIWQRREVFKGTGRIRCAPHRINVPENTKPICEPLRRRSPQELEVERKAMHSLLTSGIMEPSTSPWATHNVFVKKKDGTIRTTTDFRRLNSVTTADAYPMEDMGAAVEWLAEHRIFTVVDLKHGFFQIDLDQASREFTAVRTCLGLLQYCRLPQGLKNSPAVCQRAVNHVLGDLRGKEVLAYMDDILCGTRDEREHIMLVAMILDRFLDAGARLQLSKCRFGVRDVEALGHRVTKDGIRPSTAHTDALRAMREPTDAASLLRFLGVVSFFSKFIPDAATHMAPLYQVLGGTGWNKKKSRSRPVVIPDFLVRWTEQCRDSWAHLLETLLEPEVLVSPRRDGSLKLVTDASDIAYGAVLLQSEAGSGADWRPIGYVARKLRGAEARYTVTEKEAGAVVFAVMKFRHILLGRHFKLVTDHTALRSLLAHDKAKGRLARWAIAIQEYSFEVEYCKGGEGPVATADALSRDVSFTYRVRATGAPCVCCGGMDDEITELERVKALQETAGPELERENGVVVERDPTTVRSNPATSRLEDDMPSDADILQAQQRDLKEGHMPKAELFQNEAGIYCRTRVGTGGPQVWIPNSLQRCVLRWAHGNQNGHFGVARTRARLRGTFWPGMERDVAGLVSGCLNCFLVSSQKPGKQASMVQWTPSRRFEVVAADVLTVSPTTKAGMKKVLVITDCFTRFVVAVALPDETAPTLVRTLLERWFLVFGPPERFLTDRGTSFTGKLLCSVAAKLGVKKVWTSAYHPQCDGMVERLNRTLTKALRSLVVFEDRWDESLSSAVWHYNTSQHAVTKLTPFRAMLGVDAWDFTWNLNLELKKEQAEALSEPERLADDLQAMHDALHGRDVKARSQAAEFYDRAVVKITYAVGDRVLIWQPAAAVDTGRKLHVPWVGPCHLTAIAGVVATGKSEVTGSIIRAHVNRLKKIPEGLVETSGVAGGYYPDTRRLISAIVGVEKETDSHGGRRFKIKSVGRAGSRWTADLPDIVKHAYLLANGSDDTPTEQ
jgi:transposase InsO family protein